MLNDGLSLAALIDVLLRAPLRGYALAAAKALPHATQVADRWHLMENATSSVRDAAHQVKKVKG
jgi:hypothetical protein